MNVRSGWIEVAGQRARLSPREMVRGLADGLRAEVRRSSIRFRLWVGFLLAVLALAAVAAAVAIPPGWEVAGTSPTFEWGLFIVGYVFFAIMTSGLCLSASLGTVFGIERFRPLERRHLVLAILSLTAAFIVIALDLHYPIRMVFGAVLVPSPSSPMWWMGVFYGGYLVFLLVELYATWFHKRRLHQVTSLLTTGAAIAAPSTLGAVFGFLVAKPFWFGAFTPLQMLVTALLAGSALLGIVFAAVVAFRLEGFEKAARLAIPGVRMVLGVALVAATLLLFRQIAAGLLSETPGARDAAWALVAGPLAGLFWVRVAVGLSIPLAIVVLPAGRTARGAFAASILALPMVLVDRFTFVAGGQVAPTTAIAGNVAAPWAAYTPSPVEILVVLGAAAFVALGYTFAERYLDLRESPEGHPILPVARLGAWLSRRRTSSPGPTIRRGRHAAADPVAQLRASDLREARLRAAVRSGDGGAM